MIYKESTHASDGAGESIGTNIVKSRHIFREFFSPGSRSSLKFQLARGSAGSFTLQVCNSGFSLLVGILLARMLGVDGYGAYAYALALIQILTIPTVMGLPQLMTRETAVYQVRKEYGRMRGLLVRANQFVLVLSLGTAAIAALISLAFADRFAPVGWQTFLISLALLPLLGLNNLRMAALRGLGRVVYGQMPEMLFRPVIFISILGIAFFILPQGLSPQWAMVFQVAATGLSFIAGASILMHYIPAAALKSSAIYETRSWLKSALPFMLLGAMQMVNNRTDIVMLGMFRTVEEVGIYQAVVSGASLVMFILSAVNMAIAPTISELYAKGDLKRLQRMVTYSARAILAGTLPLVLILMIAGPWLLSTLFGTEFGAGGNALRILALGQLVCASMGSVGVILHMTGYERDAAKSVLVSVVTNILLNLILIPNFGIAGAAVATAISLSLWYMLLAVLVFRRIGLSSSVFQGSN